MNLVHFHIFFSPRIISTGAGVSNTLALVSKLGDIHGYPSGAHVTSFLGLTTPKHISGTTLFQSKRIARQGSANGRYAAVNVVLHLSHRVQVPGHIQPHQEP
jgi:hypothetical protein